MNPPPDSALADPQHLVADLQRELANAQRELVERAAERDEALAQQAATAEVLKVINSSPGNLTPVFEAMLEKAMRLCEARLGILLTYDGSVYQTASLRGAPAPYVEFMMRGPIRPGPTTGLARLSHERCVIHIADLADDQAYRERDPLRVASVELGGMRTFLAVPLVKDDALLGALVIYRQEVRPFTDKQIALLQNFAAQAVIAMENARLITETREALEQQTATAEVLGVINASPGDLAPVFDAMLEKAMRLCEAAFGQLDVYEDGDFNTVASRGMPAAWAKYRRDNPPRYGPGTQPARLLGGERLVHVVDLKAEEAYANGEPNRRSLVDLGGARSSLMVPLLRDNAVIGFISFYRQEVRPFTDKQIALLHNFAAQAVIAMENARLLDDLRTRTDDLQQSLEYQTATSDVLKVISRSTFDLQPVLDTLAEAAARLCDAGYGAIFRRDGEVYRVATVFAFSPDTTEAAHKFQAYLEHHPLTVDRGSVTGRTVLAGHAVQVADTASDPEYTINEATSLGKLRTQLGVPLLREGEPIGVIVVARQRVEPFTERQIELVRTFAAQAVIAIENTRLITETREALEQQTATSEVLGVINSSPGDLRPVFDAMLEKAIALCEATFGTLWTYDGEHMHAAAVLGATPRYTEFLRAAPHSPSPVAHQPLLGGAPAVHIPDVSAHESYHSGSALPNALVDLGGVRTLLAVPLRKDGALLGVFSIYRSEVRPFTDKQIALLQNFAAQAVIAMENARLITETREALEQQTATAEILGVISSSGTDVKPVFDAIVEHTIKLCDAEFTAVARYEDDGLLGLVATNNLSSEEAAAFHSLFPREPTRGFVMGRAFLSEEPVNVADVLADPDYDERTRIVLQSLTKYRSFLAVPIIREGRAIGVIGCARREVRPFTSAQIELVSTFADQAVIAIENARLLSEIQQRQAELRVTFDNMADGVVMFDENLRLGAWNRNFQELLDLPDGLLAERPSYTDYLRILAERGEFGIDDVEGELNRRLENTNQEFRTERTRPDGRVIEVRRNAVPDGGFVLIYSDITERKRSEAEIRAARDAAEAAYTELKAAQANLIQAEKMASLGQLTAGIAHEIKNPLNFVNNFASLSVELLDELKEVTEPAVAALGTDERAEVDETIEMLSGNLEKIAEHGKRADNIVKSMLEHSRGVSGERREVDLNNLIEEALNLAYHGARAQNQDFNITLERDYAASLKPIELAPQEITRVFLNLFGNGFYAANRRAQANGDGSFHPILAVATREAEDAVEVRVRDNGTGIAPEIKDKLFQPFFTTKPTGEGTGLGLSISYDIVTQQHGGTITVESEPGSYTEFILRLPRQ